VGVTGVMQKKKKKKKEICERADEVVFFGLAF
jgi:hypothetical protein